VSKMQTINTIKKLRIRSSNQEMEQAVAGAKGTLNRGIGRTATAVVSCRSLVVGRWSMVFSPLAKQFRYCGRE